MCVALPARITWVGSADGVSRPARAVIGEREVTIDLALVPEAMVGDHVIVHAGYAIAVVGDDSVASDVAALLATTGR